MMLIATFPITCCGWQNGSRTISGNLAVRRLCDGAPYSWSAAGSFHFFHPGQDCPGNGLVLGVNREDLGHVALLLGEEHGRAMVRAFHAQLVVQRLVTRAHATVDV